MTFGNEQTAQEIVEHLSDGSRRAADGDNETSSPSFSRCSVGRGKWFWVTHASFRDLFDGIVHASGVARTAVEAEEEARAAILAAFQCDCPDQDGANHARYIHHLQSVKRRTAKSSAATEASTSEFVYSDWVSDFDSSVGSSPYRIVKKTAKRVYVEWDHWPWEEGDQVFYDVRTFVLDRQELEATGVAWSRRRKGFFHTTPYEKRRETFKPKHLEILGLEAGCSAEAVGVAYRGLAKRLHPDHGGNPESFKQLQWAYESALAELRC